ncbi:hypothetical protein FGLOB1_2429 [Fusarium globosum]|uniref:Uncharacterized protein n=1 Tax=Fusarium globosum TaxID=78864 RepID=A0A8H5YQJ4_9HYPO|nr:hypothetical protein FGLOB1_2429 [Fusarium globosum]
MPGIFENVRCDGCQAMIEDTETSAVLFYCADYPTGNWRHLTLNRSSRPTITQNTRCTFLHRRCFDTFQIMLNGQQRSQAKINCFRRAIGFRKLDFMRIFQEGLHIPGLHSVSMTAVVRAEKCVFHQSQILRKVTGIQELFDIVRSYCPDAYFWNMVQLMGLRGFASTGTPVMKDLSRIEKWKRLQPLPVCGRPLKDPGCLRISLDSDGICEIERLGSHPHPPNHDPLVKLRKYVLANEKDLATVKAYF